MKDWSVTLTRIGEFMLKRIGTVWYFCTTRHFNLFSKDLRHSVISLQFYNTKRCFAERKAKTSRLWILDTGHIAGRDVFWYQWWIYDLKQLIYTFCWTKDGKGQKYFEDFRGQKYFEDFRLLSNVDDISRTSSHRAKRKNSLDNGWWKLLV